MSIRPRAPAQGRQMPPLILNWTAERPLPVQEVRPGNRRLLLPQGHEAPAWLDTGSHAQPFDFTLHVRRLCEDIAARFEPLAHLDVSRILFGFTQARNGRSHGLQARVTPLRFRDGELTRPYRGVPFQVQRYFVNGREILYVIAFCLPRFLDRDYEDKFVTLFHELFHISPAFDGDLRRHGGRYDVHTASQRRYDEEMRAMAHTYLRAARDASKYAFLRLNFAQLLHRHGCVTGQRVPRPKLIPLR